MLQFLRVEFVRTLLEQDNGVDVLNVAIGEAQTVLLLAVSCTFILTKEKIGRITGGTLSGEIIA